MADADLVGGTLTRHRYHAFINDHDSSHLGIKALFLGLAVSYIYLQPRVEENQGFQNIESSLPCRFYGRQEDNHAFGVINDIVDLQLWGCFLLSLYR